VSLRFACLAVLRVFALLARSGRARDAGILIVRYQVAVPRRRVRAPGLSRADRAVPAALARLLPPGSQFRRLRLIVWPRTVLCWHASLVRRHRACPRRAPGRPRTGQSVRARVPGMARDNPGWGCRRIHGELAGPGRKPAPPAVWRILKDAGIDPAPRSHEVTYYSAPTGCTDLPMSGRFGLPGAGCGRDPRGGVDVCAGRAHTAAHQVERVSIDHAESCSLAPSNVPASGTHAYRRM
jgi:hypothetical protein